MLRGSRNFNQLPGSVRKDRAFPQSLASLCLRCRESGRLLEVDEFFGQGSYKSLLTTVPDWSAIYFHANCCRVLKGRKKKWRPFRDTYPHDHTGWPLPT
ncbi:hypothetical protein EMCRGX_G033021 [Ephydatia muelleri]